MIEKIRALRQNESLVRAGLKALLYISIVFAGFSLTKSVQDITTPNIAISDIQGDKDLEALSIIFVGSTWGALKLTEKA